ncbi:MAG: hypothetical protein ABI947_09745 [Chloroflexota bacterium]
MNKYGGLFIVFCRLGASRLRSTDYRDYTPKDEQILSETETRPHPICPHSNVGNRSICRSSWQNAIVKRWGRKLNSSVNFNQHQV